MGGTIYVSMVMHSYILCVVFSVLQVFILTVLHDLVMPSFILISCRVQTLNHLIQLLLIPFLGTLRGLEIELVTLI